MSFNFGTAPGLVTAPWWKQIEPAEGSKMQSVPRTAQHIQTQFCTEAGMRSTGLSLFWFDTQFWPGPFLFGPGQASYELALPPCLFVILYLAACLGPLLAGGRRGGAMIYIRRQRLGGGNRWGGGKLSQPAFEQCWMEHNRHNLKFTK